MSRFSVESEYRGLANAAIEVSWIEYVLHELQVQLPSPPLLLCGNVSATGTKHIEIDYHFIRERVTNNTLRIAFTPSTDQLADAITKALLPPHFFNMRSKLTILTKSIFKGTL